MRKATLLVSLSVACGLVPSCGNDTGIILEISMSSELKTSLEQNNEDFDSLRVWVGHATEDPSFFRASADAFFTTPRNRAGLVEPYRYLLEPTGELADIGPLVFAAAIGTDPTDARLPFHIVGFDVADSPMGFADGEMRVVPLELVADAGVQGGIDDACIVWGTDTADPSRIAPSDDLDCDGAVGQDDCDDLDPSQNNLDRDGDGFASCAGDCMDDPRFETPWVDPANVHPGATDIGESDTASCDHIDEDCDGNCQSANFDVDGSGATVCGQVSGDGGFCDVLAADCDEQRAGDQPALFNTPEACNARDDSCDGFLPPKLPCVIFDGSCHWGQVECDELEGEYRGENDTLLCKTLPDSFSDSEAPPGFCDGTPAAGCYEDGDPIGCAFEAVAVNRVACHSTASPTCRPDRATLSFPNGSTDSCEWHIIGGTLQAEWEVGFVSGNAPVDAIPLQTIRECMPQLAVRSRVATPAARTVLLLFRSPSTPAFGARPMVIHLDNEVLGDCTGFLACTNLPGG